MEFIDQFFIFPVYVFHVSADVPCFLPRSFNLTRVGFGEKNGSIISCKSHDLWNFPHFPFDHDNDLLIPTIDYNISSTLTDTVDSSSYEVLSVNSWFHNCVLYGRPSTRYYYRIPATLQCVLQSKTYSFEALSPFSIINPINITIIGDFGNDRKMNHNSATSLERRHPFNGAGVGEAAEDANATMSVTASVNIIPDTYDYTR